MVSLASENTYGPPNSKPCACGCSCRFADSLTAVTAFSTVLVGEAGGDDFVGEGGSTGPEDFFTLDARALFGAIVDDSSRNCNATMLAVVRSTDSTLKKSGRGG